MTMSASKDGLCLKESVVVGAATAAVTRTITGIATTDTIVSAIIMGATAISASTAAVTADITISAANTITCGTNVVVPGIARAVKVLWLDNSA